MKINFQKSSHDSNEKKISNELISKSFEDSKIANITYYEWQYLKNPIGNGIILFAYQGNELAGQYAVIPSLYRFNDKKFTLMIGLNLCVSPRFRGKGISSKLIQEMNNYSGSAPFIIGVPNEQAMNAHLKNTSDFLDLTILIRPIRISNYFHNKFVRFLSLPFNLIWKTRRKILLEEYSMLFDKRFDDFEIRVNKKNVIKQIRNSNFLNWRYKNNPKSKYKVFISENSSGEIEGYIITRITEINGKRFGLIMDYVVENTSNSVRNLIRNVLEDFLSNEVSFAVASCFPNCTEYNMFQKEGFFVCPKFLRPHPFKFFIKTLDQSELKKKILLDSHNWFFSFGDYDVF